MSSSGFSPGLPDGSTLLSVLQTAENNHCQTSRSMLSLFTSWIPLKTGQTIAAFTRWIWLLGSLWDSTSSLKLWVSCLPEGSSQQKATVPEDWAETIVDLTLQKYFYQIFLRRNNSGSDIACMQKCQQMKRQLILKGTRLALALKLVTYTLIIVTSNIYSK